MTSIADHVATRDMAQAPLLTLTLPRSAKDLISKLLVTDARRRLSPAQALAHPWLNAPITDTMLTRTRENMRRHLTAKRRFKARLPGHRMWLRSRAYYGGHELAFPATSSFGRKNSFSPAEGPSLSGAEVVISR